MRRFSIPAARRNLDYASLIGAHRWGGPWPKQLQRDQQREATIERLLRESEAEEAATQDAA